MSDFPKRCGCGRAYDAAAWAALPLVGGVAAVPGVTPALELRNCVCGSTLAVEL